jgi:hypothetical protein
MATVRPATTPRQAPPPPPRQRPKVTRLAALRAHGDLFASGPGRQASNWLAGAALYFGTAIAGAVWIGGALFDVRETAAAAADEAVAGAGFAAGFAVYDERGARLEGVRLSEVEMAVMPEGRRSMIAASPQDMRERLLDLPWVSGAVVQRHWPSSIKIQLHRRPAAVASAARAGA